MRPSTPNAPSTTPAVPELSAAATTVARRPAGDSGSSRAEKARSRPFAVGIRLASASVPASWPGVSKWGNSTSASGFPRAASRIDFSTSGAMRPSFAASTLVESSRSSGPTGTSWRPGMFGAPGLCAATKTAGTPARRREANESASRDAESTHCRSSTTISVGPSSAAAARSPSVATPTAKRSKAPGGTERKRRRQGGSLGLRERVETVQYRRQHVDERRIGEIGLGLHSGRLENRHLTRVLDQAPAGVSSCRCQARLPGRTPLRHRLARRRAPSQASRTPPRGRTASSASLGLSPARAGRRAPMVEDGAFSLVVPAARHRPARARNLYERTDLDRSGEPAVAVAKPRDSPGASGAG